MPGRPSRHVGTPHVSGKVDGLPAGRNLALAVNGRIRAVARTYDFLGKTRFSFMAPEGAFRPGADDAGARRDGVGQGPTARGARCVAPGGSRWWVSPSPGRWPAPASAAASGAVAPAATPTQAQVGGARTPVVFISLDEFSLASLLRAPAGDRCAPLSELRRAGAAEHVVREHHSVRRRHPLGHAGRPWPASCPTSAASRSRRTTPAACSPCSGARTASSSRSRSTRLCPASLCRGHTLPGRTRKQKAQALNALIPGEKKHAAKHSELADFIARLRPWRSGRPPFYYIDVLMPHHPYVWLPSGRRCVSPDAEIPGLFGDNMWRNNPALVDRAWQRYLLQVGYTDLLIGRLIRKMKATGLWDRALLVILPDHGVSFVPGNSRRMATRVTLGGIGVIPLFMKLPGQKLGRRVDEHVQTIHVLPTVAGRARPSGAARHRRALGARSWLQAVGQGGALVDDLGRDVRAPPVPDEPGGAPLLGADLAPVRAVRDRGPRRALLRPRAGRRARRPGRERVPAGSARLSVSLDGAVRGRAGRGQRRVRGVGAGRLLAVS